MACRVLIVDDAIFMRSMLKDILVRHGFKVVGEAENGKDAVEKYKEVNPDMVTMDIVMPQMNGIESVKEILKHDPKAWIVMCSALGQEALVTESIEAGAKDFIVKPFSPDKVVKIITQVSDASD
ncbi:MAG: two-component system response regulator [Candidatus Schekmanbacteria bacterium RBG_13_48_7]|uniref:Two-component system response regulator n=1 Tax=Candidatus Schekmanbacteria bacterium RBG_13_48_7 TaxID=1817878 RepID=A0A1F7RQJ5_9BACT|nr:MAG: two-component system response regulator [Candidatus Schekmanbacteria bacterium RBG_13_48_7]